MCLDGLYVLLKPIRKRKNQSEEEAAKHGPKAPRHLQHLVTSFTSKEICPWSLSGPQFPTPTAIQQRYCYPKGRLEYSSQKGGALWTMYGKDGKEDFTYRLLHVYFSAKRASNKGASRYGDAQESLPMSPASLKKDVRSLDDPMKSLQRMRTTKKYQTKTTKPATASTKEEIHSGTRNNANDIGPISCYKKSFPFGQSVPTPQSPNYSFPSHHTHNIQSSELSLKFLNSFQCDSEVSSFTYNDPLNSFEGLFSFEDEDNESELEKWWSYSPTINIPTTSSTDREISSKSSSYSLRIEKVDSFAKSLQKQRESILRDISQAAKIDQPLLISKFVSWVHKLLDDSLHFGGKRKNVPLENNTPHDDQCTRKAKFDHSWCHQDKVKVNYNNTFYITTGTNEHYTDTDKEMMELDNQFSYDEFDSDELSHLFNVYFDDNDDNNDDQFDSL